MENFKHQNVSLDGNNTSERIRKVGKVMQGYGIIGGALRRYSEEDIKKSFEIAKNSL